MSYSLRQRAKDKKIMIYMWFARLFARIANWFNDCAECHIEDEMRAMSVEIRKVMASADRENAKSDLH